MKDWPPTLGLKADLDPDLVNPGQLTFLGVRWLSGGGWGRGRLGRA